MRPIPQELTSGPFTIRRASELGLSRSVLDGRRFTTPWSGVRTAGASSTSLADRCRAAVLVLPDAAVFSHDTALHLGGWLTPTVRDGRARYVQSEPSESSPVHVTVPRQSAKPERNGLVSHRSDLVPEEITCADGLRITSPWRTWCDLGSTASETDLVVLADALRRSVGLIAYVHEVLAVTPGRRRGVRTLRAALARSVDGVDSPMETRLRLIFVTAGLPEPLVNHWVTRADGTPLHRPDLSWPEWRVAADYDGRHHNDRDSEESVRLGRGSEWRARQDTSRRDLLEEEGWILRVFTSFDVFRAPERSAERMRTALRMAGAEV